MNGARRSLTDSWLGPHDRQLLILIDLSLPATCFGLDFDWRSLSVSNPVGHSFALIIYHSIVALVTIFTAVNLAEVSKTIYIREIRKTFRTPTYYVSALWCAWIDCKQLSNNHALMSTLFITLNCPTRLAFKCRSTNLILNTGHSIAPRF